MAISGGAAAVSLISIGLSAYSSKEKGDATASANQFQADKATDAAKFGRLQADLTNTTATEKLNSTLGNIDAIRAAAHVDPTSPTTAAVEDWQTEISNRNRLAAEGTIESQASSDAASADYLAKAGAFAQLQGYLGAGVDVTAGVSKGLYNYNKPTGTG
jgi:hypothetical protein